MGTEAQDLKVRENRLRRAAVRQGMFLSRRRRRDEFAIDFGRYAILVENADGPPVRGVGLDGNYTMTLDQVEAFLTGCEKATKEYHARKAAEADALAKGGVTATEPAPVPAGSSTPPPVAEVVFQPPGDPVAEPDPAPKPARPRRSARQRHGRNSI